MKKYLLFILTSVLLLASCQKDDLSWMQEIESIKTELANQKKLIEALQANANITGIETNADSYTIKFSNGQSITLSNGKTPLVTIGDNGNWFINGEDTGCPSRGEDGVDGSDGVDGADGADGVTPTIEIIDGYWWINGYNSGIRATGYDGIDGQNAPFIISATCNEKEIIFTFSDGTSITCTLEYLDSYPTNYKGNEFMIFNKVLAIGDSMTAGVFNTYDNYYTSSAYSFPLYLHKISGVSVTNWGIGGNTTKGWYENKCNTSWEGYDCAIIQLGINDLYRNETGLTQEYLGLIIEKLKKENKGIKIFVSTIIRAKSYDPNRFKVVSDLIRDFVSERDDCYLTDMAMYSHTLDEDAYNAGHLSALGYWRLAMDYYSYIGYIIHTNPGDFKNVQFIGTNNEPYGK